MAGVSSPSHLAAVADSARRLRAEGDLDGARAALEQALIAARPMYGEDHPEVLVTAHLLAGVRREMGDPAAARRVLEDALAAGSRRFGEGEPVVLAISFDLGGVAEELGNRHEARRNFGRVAEQGPAVFGLDHWMVRAARSYLVEEAPAAPPTMVYTPQQRPGSARPANRFGAPTQQPVPAITVPASGYKVGVQRPRAATVAAGVAATVAAALAAVVVVGDDRSPPVAGPGGGPTTLAPVVAAAPTGVKLDAGGEAVGLSWADPADGRVPFVVTGGRRGERQAVMAQLDPGVTGYRVNGLNPRLDYCFTVIALYSATQLAKSDQVCTDRATDAPAT